MPERRMPAKKEMRNEAALYKIGLLPLFMELLNKAIPDMRPRLDSFVETIAEEFGRRGIQVFRAPLSGLRKDIRGALKMIEENKPDALVTLHLTYSPSLEAISELVRTRLPIIILDTTPVSNFSAIRDPLEIMFNHGIHGVQDLCNLLNRNGRRFAIEAGHWKDSDVLDRIAGRLRQARFVTALSRTRVGSIGDRFPGMGDFRIEPEVLRSAVGARIVICGPERLKGYTPEPGDPELEEEIAADRHRFNTEGLDPEVYQESLRIGLSVRRWLNAESLDAFTMNPLAFQGSSHPEALPFLEASKAMARGIGYAGEGDVLTAALNGAILQSYRDATFIEMFCPDWENGRIFLSHVAEMNHSLTKNKPRLVDKQYLITGCRSTVAVGILREGKATLVNLAPTGGHPRDGGPLRMILVSGEMVEVPGEQIEKTIYGWFKPDLALESLLAEYSTWGGTHHSVLVYGDVTADLAEAGRLMSWDVRNL